MADGRRWTHRDVISPLDLRMKGIQMGQVVLKSFGLYSELAIMNKCVLFIVTI